jgi:hypothetical protein
MPNNLTCPMPNKDIIVNVDPLLANSIFRNNAAAPPLNQPLLTTQKIRINLMKLIIAAATIQTARTNPTLFEKLFEGSYLLEFIRDCNDFCIIKHLDSDKQRRISEDLGVGLSVLVTDHYYKIDWTTLGKIPRRKKSAPDISCMSLSNESITIEAKGSIDAGWNGYQRSYAQDQKRGPIPSNVSVASCALLIEASISRVDYLDPPLIPPEDPEYSRSLLKADHYARIFNLIGQKELSEYFNYMRQRVLHDRDFRQFDRKQELYEKIKTKYVKIGVGHHVYFGNIERHDDDSLIFIGVDERLLNVYSFIQFEGREDNYVETDDGNFYLSADGLCIGYLRSLQSVKGQIQYDQIPNHYDSFSIVDFDRSREKTLTNYLSHVIGKIGGKVQKEFSIDRRYDLAFSLNNKEFVLEIKRYSSDRYIESILAELQRVPPANQAKLILVTNIMLSDKHVELIRSRKIILIDRMALRKIIEDNETILEYLQ